MSRENVEIARRGLEAAWRRPKPDFATINALFDPEHELVTATSRLEGGSLRGGRGFRGFLDNWDETWESWEARVDQVKSIDDERVLVFAVVTAMGRRSRVPVERRFAMVATVRDGKVTRTESYDSPEEAREAVGLAE